MLFNGKYTNMLNVLLNSNPDAKNDVKKYLSNLPKRLIDKLNSGTMFEDYEAINKQTKISYSSNLYIDDNGGLYLSIARFSPKEVSAVKSKYGLYWMDSIVVILNPIVAENNDKSIADNVLHLINLNEDGLCVGMIKFEYADEAQDEDAEEYEFLLDASVAVQYNNVQYSVYSKNQLKAISNAKVHLTPPKFIICSDNVKNFYPRYVNPSAKEMTYKAEIRLEDLVVQQSNIKSL